MLERVPAFPVPFVVTLRLVVRLDVCVRLAVRFGCTFYCAVVPVRCPTKEGDEMK